MIQRFRSTLPLLALAWFASKVAAHPGHGTSGHSDTGLIHYLIDHSLGGWPILLACLIALVVVAGKPLMARLRD